MITVNAMVLFRQNDQWMVQYQGPHTEQIKRAFHTDTLPLPFTAKALAGEVWQALKSKHPGIRIGIKTKDVNAAVVKCLRQGHGDILWMK